MSLFGLLTRGIDAVLAEPEFEAELKELLTERRVEVEATPHIIETLRATPGLLVLIQESLTEQRAPASARELFLTTVEYLLQENDLIPSHEGKPVYGLLDDVYLLHLAAFEIRDFLGRVDERSISGGLQLLERLLPLGVVRQLQGLLASRSVRS